MVRFAQLRREDCKCRILTGKGHAFKTKLRLWDPLLSPWKQEIQLEDELTKLPRRGKLLTSLPWWWLRDVVVCWSLFSNFVLTFTFPTVVLHCCCCCCKGELFHAAFFLSFFLLYFARRENWPAKTGLFSRIVRFFDCLSKEHRDPTTAALTWLYSRDTIAGCIYASLTIARLASLAWTTLLKKKRQSLLKKYRDMSPHILPSYHTSFKKLKKKQI